MTRSLLHTSTSAGPEDVPPPLLAEVNPGDFAPLAPLTSDLMLAVLSAALQLLPVVVELLQTHDSVL